MTVAPVCRVGDPLQLMCTASVEFIRWSILRVNEQGRLEMISSDVIINSRDSNNQMTPITLDSATFTFMRSSVQFASPLISTLSINSVSIGFNGTVVHCSDIANPMTSASTMIQIINSNQSELVAHYLYITCFHAYMHESSIDYQYSPVLRISDEHYEADGVIVTVEWIQQDGIAYSARVSPSALITSNGSTSHQLTIPYNIEYNFSVEAVAPCRPNTTAFIRLNYGEVYVLVDNCTM